MSLKTETFLALFGIFGSSRFYCKDQYQGLLEQIILNKQMTVD